MGSKTQLTAADVERGLKAAGFVKEKGRGGGHSQWIYDNNGIYAKVTVDAHVEPFGHDLIHYMARQAKMTVPQFVELCSKDGCKAAKRGKLDWLTNIFN